MGAPNGNHSPAELQGTSRLFTLGLFMSRLNTPRLRSLANIGKDRPSEALRLLQATGAREGVLHPQGHRVGAQVRYKSHSACREHIPHCCVVPGVRVRACLAGSTLASSLMPWSLSSRRTEPPCRPSACGKPPSVSLRNCWHSSENGSKKLLFRAKSRAGKRRV